MSSSDWDSFWVWALVVPIAAFLIYINIIKIKKSDLKFNFSFKKIFDFIMEAFFAFIFFCKTALELIAFINF